MTTKPNYSFSRAIILISDLFFTKTKFSTQKSCRYLGIQIDRNLSFDEQLNKTFKNGSCSKIDLPNKTSSSPEQAHSSSKITCALTLIIFGNLFPKCICKKPKTP